MGRTLEWVSTVPNAFLMRWWVQDSARPLSKRFGSAGIRGQVSRSQALHVRNAKSTWFGVVQESRRACQVVGHTHMQRIRVASSRLCSLTIDGICAQFSTSFRRGRR